MVSTRMLIWRGHGVLILVFGILGGLLTGMVVGAASLATQWGWLTRMVGPANLWGAALGIYLYGRTIGKTIIKTYLDPATRQPVAVKTSHTLFFIPPMPWAVLAGLMACVVTVGAFMQPAENFMNDVQLAVASPGKAAFKVANRLIDSDKGTTAYGNTPDAEKLAFVFSEMVMRGREMGVQKAKKKSVISLSHGKFLSYCRINPDSCVFMVHVPDLRKFSDDAKRFMVGLAWTVASKQAVLLTPRPKRVVVGVRGAFLYDEVVEGPVPDAGAIAENEASESWEAGIEQRFSGDDAMKHLESCFEPHAEGAVLPVLGAGAGDGTGGAAVISIEEFNELSKRVGNLAPGQADGNVPSAKALAAAYAKAVRAGFPFPPAMSENVPAFAAYVHLRNDTAAFMLCLPGDGQMPPGAFARTEPVAWGLASKVAEQMTPRPRRLVLVFLGDGQITSSFLSARDGPQADGAWKIEQEISGSDELERLLPYFSAPSGEVISVKSPIKSPMSGSTLAAGSPAKPMQEPASAPTPAAVPTPPATPAAASPLPTPVRDWKDSTGRVMQASLESFTTPAKDVGRFKRADGQMFEVPFSRLSAEDQEYIRGIEQKVK